LVAGSFGCNAENRTSVKFSISSDIHKGTVPDANERLSSYLQKVETLNLDFMVDLGDFCLTSKENKEFIDLWKDSPIETYNVLGNHDMDYGSKEDFMAMVGMDKRFYSFDKGGIHFIILDPNNLYIEGEYLPYGNANFYCPFSQRAFVDPQQLDWLKEDLKQTDKHCVIFSHQSFENPKACQNQKEVRRILEEANREAGFNKVIAAFSGHNHTDYAKEINGIHYVQINSMTASYVGPKYRCTSRYSQEINEKYPGIMDSCPYTDALFAVVTIKDGKLIIEGVESTFVQPGPESVGLTDGTVHGLPLTPKISDRVIDYK
jgi:3',5'-cyclic AMP phosphodiesterase CpdA